MIKMGCCQSEEKEEQDPTERSRLLEGARQKSPSSNVPIGSGSNSYGTVTDEEGRLNQILQKTAENLIDIGDVEPHSLDHSEVVGRRREYDQRVSAWKPSVPRGGTKLPSGGAAPTILLSKELVSPTDIGFISDKANTLSEALDSMEVKASEPVVVPFTTT